MRLIYAVTTLCLGGFALLSLTPEPAEACGRRHYGPVYYQPAPMYYQAAPMYYQPSYARGYAQPGPTTIVTIGAYDNYFEPGTIRVQPGTTVRWVNKGKHKHTVTANNGLWDSGDLAAGDVYSVTFIGPGTHYYYCRHHMKDKMQGTIVVGYGGGPGGGYGPSGY